MFRAKLHKSNKAITPKSDVLLVIGDGRSMPDDLACFRGWNVAHDTGSIGRSIKHLGYDANHWWNADGETAIAWVQAIKAQSRNGLVTHTMGEVNGFDADWDIEQPDYHFEDITHQKGRIHGSSAMFAALTGIELGYKKIVLAGCPMDHEGHWYFEQNRETLGPMWIGVDFMAWIDFAKEQEASRVRSMSGYTAKILGQAEREWILG